MLSPDQVTSRAYSDLMKVTMMADNPNIPAPERMAHIVRIAEEFRKNVEGSTTDPFRNLKHADNPFGHPAFKSAGV